MKIPTLADALLRESFRPATSGAQTLWFRKTLAEARKFVLDPAMSAFMSDLAYASLVSKDSYARVHATLDGMRSLARLPHRAIFIEYDFRAKAERANREYGAGIDLSPGTFPDRDGWLCSQHPQLETAFLAIPCCSHTYDIELNERRERAEPNFLAWQWRCDDGAPPWPKYVPPGYEHPESIMTGILSYRNDNVQVTRSPAWNDVLWPIVQNHFDRRLGCDPLAEFASDLRYLWALLATINDLPTKIIDVKQTRGYVARGSYRKYSDHRIITLTVPVSRYRQLGKNAIAVARRKAHDVRGHWRKDWRHVPAPLCDHEWVGEEHATACKFCGGRRIWIADHQRGDASLGFVLHDYSVTHPTKEATNVDS